MKRGAGTFQKENLGSERSTVGSSRYSKHTAPTTETWIPVSMLYPQNFMDGISLNAPLFSQLFVGYRAGISQECLIFWVACFSLRWWQTSNSLTVASWRTRGGMKNCHQDSPGTYSAGLEGWVYKDLTIWSFETGQFFVRHACWKCTG